MNIESFQSRISSTLLASDDMSGLELVVNDELQRCNNDAEKSELYFELGRMLWKHGNKGAAISAYEESVQLDADSPAAAALEMAREIMDFYHHDLYNP